MFFEFCKQKRKIITEDVAKFTILRDDMIQRFTGELIRSKPCLANLITFIEHIKPHLKADPSTLPNTPEFNKGYFVQLLVLI